MRTIGLGLADKVIHFKILNFDALNSLSAIADLFPQKLS